MFDEIKWIVECDTLLIYADLNKHYDIHTGDSEYQLGAVIGQDGKPITFYSRKIPGPQAWYTVTEKELLGKVKILTELPTILLGKKLKIYTDH